MVFTNDFKFPSEEELTTQECPLGTPYIRAGAHHLGRYCEAQNNEFMLCRHETKDPIKCLPEGKVVTSCTNEFFKKVKATCGETFTQYAMCLEQKSGRMESRLCRDIQAKFDNCMKENMGLDRPPLGYYSLIRVHDSNRPAPEVERPAWMDDPRGGKRPDGLPGDFPRTPYKGATGSMFGIQAF